MSLTSDPVQLYTQRSRSYLCFVHAVAYPQGIRAYFRQSALLHSNIHVLDAGCGTGIATLALRDAILSRGFQPGTLKGFDITCSMLETFRETLRKKAIKGIEVVQADVLHLETLSDDWKNFNLIISAAMMEYLPREHLVDALSGLRSRLSDTGSVVLFITRENWLIRPLIGHWWKANFYQEAELEKYFRRAGFSTIIFRSFPFPYRHLSLWGHIIEAR